MNNSQETKELDKIFEALANQHRREIIYALSLQPHAISQLATMRNLSLPAIYKHIKILKDSALILEKKIGRTHFLILNTPVLRNLQEWLMQYYAYWGSNEATFANYEHYLNSKKQVKGGDKK